MLGNLTRGCRVVQKTKKARIVNPNIRFLDQKLRFQESVHVALQFTFLSGVRSL